MIPTIDQEIIQKLNQGMSPAEISIEYQKLGKNVPASYVRHINMILKADILEWLEEESDIEADARIASVAMTSREYERMRNNQQR